MGIQNFIDYYSRWQGVKKKIESGNKYCLNAGRMTDEVVRQSQRPQHTFRLTQKERPRYGRGYISQMT
jgi:hypothetical protein